jgi:hypothetical protein
LAIREAEFKVLHSAIRFFASALEFIGTMHANFANSMSLKEESGSTYDPLIKREILSLINSISDLDDDVTSSWMFYLVTENYLDSQVNQREILRQKTMSGVSKFFSKEEIFKNELAVSNYLEQTTDFISLFAGTVDTVSVIYGIEPIAIRMYAQSALSLSSVIARTSVFTEDSDTVVKRQMKLAGTLVAIVELVESATADRFKDILDEIEKFEFVDGTMDDIKTCTEYRGDSESLNAWCTKWNSLCEELSARKSKSGTNSTAFSTLSERMVGLDSETTDGKSGDTFEDITHLEDAKYGEPVIKSADSSLLQRISNLDEIYERGLISNSEYKAKRRQLIAEI